MGTSVLICSLGGDSVIKCANATGFTPILKNLSVPIILLKDIPVEKTPSPYKAQMVTSSQTFPSVCWGTICGILARLVPK